MKSNGIDSAYKVPGLEKGIAILELFASSNRSMTMHEIKSAVRISQSSLYRILHTLVRLGFLRYNETSKQYKLTRKMLALGLQAIQEQNLLEIVLPKMGELRDTVKETVCFGVMGEEKGIFIEQILGTHPFCFVLTPGKLFDLHCSAPGKALMAFLPEKTRNRYLSKMDYHAYNSNTIPGEKEYLEELEVVRKRGYAVDMEEELSGVVCIGAPIFDYSNTPCGAIWISGPADRLNKSVIESDAGSIMSVTRSVSFELGHNNGNLKSKLVHT